MLILQAVLHRDRPKRQAEIRRTLGIGDAPLAIGAIRELAGARLVRTGRPGTEKPVAITPEGAALRARYSGLRSELNANPL